MLKTSNTVRTKMLAAVSGAALNLLISQTAFAQCAPAMPVAGDVVTCGAGTYTNGISFGVDNLTIVVQATSSVSNNAGAGISVGSSNSDQSLTVLGAASTVTSSVGDGIYMTNGAFASHLNLAVEGYVYGYLNGVDVDNFGTGYTDVGVNNVNAGGNAVDIYGASSATDITFVANGTVSSTNGDGVRINHNGTGSVTANVNDVSGSRGMYVRSYGVGISVSSSGDITGASSDGLRISHRGTGDVYVNATNLTGGASGEALDISTSATAGNINAQVSGNASGGGSNVVLIDHNGAGYVNVELGTVTATDASTRGIQISGNANTTNIDVTITGALSTDGSGIRIFHDGTGDATINALGGISSGGDGIYIDHGGVGAISVTTSNVTTFAGDGIDITSGTSNVTGITVVSTGTVSTTDGSSTSSGIDVVHTGTGNTTLTVNNVYSSNGAALLVSTDASTQDVRVVASGTVSGRTRGVDVTNQGTGSTYVAVTNAHTTLNYADVIVYGGLTTTNLTMFRSDTTYGFYAGLHVSGAVPGLQDVGTAVTHRGSGYINVSVGGASAYGGAGIYVNTSGYNTDLTINSSGEVTSYQETGVDVTQNGSGNTTLTLTDVTGYTGGVRVETNAFAGDLTITSTGVITTNSGTGLYVNNDANGSATEINVNNVYGSGYAMLVTTRTASSAGIDITVTGLTGGDSDIQVDDVTRNANASDVAIDLSHSFYGFNTYIYGAVDGGRFGFRSTTLTGADITLYSGASITGGTAAIRTQGGSAGDNVTSAGVINADVLLLQGSDSFTHLSGGSLDAAARIDLGTDDDAFNMNADFGALAGSIRGGLGSDTFTLGATTGTWAESGFTTSQVRQFETIEVLSGAAWTFEDTHFNYDAVNFRAGSDTDMAPYSRIFSDSVLIEDGATLNMGQGASFNRAIVQINGTLDIGGSGTTASASVLGTLNFGSTAVLNMDADAANDRDLLRVLGLFADQGEVNLDGTLNLNQTFGLEAGQYVIINAVQALNGTFATVNGLGSGGGLSQSILYNTTNNTVRVLTEVDAMTPEDTGSKSSASAANYMLAQLGNSTDYAALGFDVGVMDVAGISEFAAGMTPDVLDSAVMVSDGAALRFGQILAGCDMNFSLNAAESCAAIAGQDGPAFFGELRQTSANTGTEVGHNFNAQSFDMNVGMRLTDIDDRTQFGLMSGYAKSGSVEDALAGEARDGLEAESFSFGGYARRDLGWWSLDGTAMVSTSEAKLVRNIQPGLGIAEQAQSEFVSRQFYLQGTATLNGLGESEFAIKPLATVGNRTLQRDGFTESGADLLGLTVEGQTRNVSYAGLGAEFAPDFTDEQGNGFRGLLRVTGLAYGGDTNSEFTARFTNAPGDSSFTYFGQNLDTSVLLEGGFQYLAPNGFAIGAEGFGEVNPTTGDSSAVGATLQLIKRW